MGVCWLLGYGKLGVVGPTRQTLPDHAFEERATMKRVPEEASTPSLRASCKAHVDAPRLHHQSSLATSTQRRFPSPSSSHPLTHLSLALTRPSSLVLLPGHSSLSCAPQQSRQ